ncbi:MAG: T9SS type A sorting domain-containing protein [bacterium]|nr:T9SS type A sorting domain-containing protein [bacterium]
MRLSFYGIICLLAIQSAAFAQTFADFLSRINSAPIEERPAIVDSFMAAVPAFPFVEPPDQAHFLYRGATTSVNIPGDANGWSPTAHSMSRAGGTDLWYRTQVFESDARLDYKYVINGSSWILDPRNPFTVSGGFGPNSELRMPDFTQPVGISYYPEIAHGSLRDTMFTSANMGNTRQVRIYTPAGYSDSGDCYPLLVVHDGLEYLSLGSADRILDYHIFHGDIDPMIVVFVPPVNRTPEYAGNLQAAFGRFITEELLPFIDSAYRTCTAPTQRGTLGASYGGNIALWLGTTYPDVFGSIGAVSPFVQQSVLDTIEANADLGLNFYVDIGTYDISELIPLTTQLVQTLESQSYPHFFLTVHEGHSWGNWRGHLDDALIYLYPAESSVAPPWTPAPQSLTLAQNFPNPFNPNTSISFSLDRRDYVHLQVFDSTGRLVETLVAGTLDIGKYDFVFDGTELASGIYFAKLAAHGQVAAIKMLLVK